MDLFLARDPDLHKKIFGPFNRKQFQAGTQVSLYRHGPVSSARAIASPNHVLKKVAHMHCYAKPVAKNNDQRARGGPKLLPLYSLCVRKALVGTPIPSGRLGQK